MEHPVAPPSTGAPADQGHEIVASSFVAALLAIGFLATVVGVAPPRANPFGVMIGGGGLGLERRAALARELGVSYFRPWDINLGEWNGRHADTEHFSKAGFGIVMTVRNVGRGPAGRPALPPTDIEAYKAAVGAILDLYKPAVLCVENEETLAASYAGTPEQYGRQLKAACEVAHAHGVKCANGGLGNTGVAAAVWDDYLSRGELAKAEAFLERSTLPLERQQLRSATGRRRAAESIRRVRALMAGYQPAGADYVNFHWYAQDPRALEEAVDFLRARTRLPAISNEVGQRNQEPRAIAPVLAKVLELELPLAIWVSLDRAPLRALQEPNGTWRESGVAARTFLWRRLPEPREPVRPQPDLVPDRVQPSTR